MPIVPSEYINASNGDGEAVRAIVTTTRGVGNMDLIVDSVLNWPNKFIATSGDLDPTTGLVDPLTVSVFYGQLTGSIITIVEFAPGYTDVGHEVGQVVVLKPTTAWADAVAAGGGGVGSGIIVSPTAPPTPEEDDFWLDETAEGDAGTNSFIFAQGVLGTVDGTNTSFSVQNGSFLGGSLQVFINGIAQARTIHYSEGTPSAGTFTFTSAPLVDDIITANYQISPASANNADTLDNYHLTAILEAIYPVGAIYVSGTSTMPALIDGIGTWTRVLGRVIVGLDEGDTDFDTPDETGGSKTHDHALAGTGYANIAGEGNNLRMERVNGPTVNQNHLQSGFTSASFSTYNTALKASLSGNTGTSSNVQPYKVKYMWERTA